MVPSGHCLSANGKATFGYLTGIYLASTELIPAKSMLSVAHRTSKETWLEYKHRSHQMEIKSWIEDTQAKLQCIPFCDLGRKWPLESPRISQ